MCIRDSCPLLPLQSQAPVRPGLYSCPQPPPYPLSPAHRSFVTSQPEMAKSWLSEKGKSSTGLGPLDHGKAEVLKAWLSPTSPLLVLAAPLLQLWAKDPEPVNESSSSLSQLLVSSGSLVCAART
eukprot:9269190-Alexandrium_andersonii.AAC.1